MEQQTQNTPQQYEGQQDGQDATNYQGSAIMDSDIAEMANVLEQKINFLDQKREALIMAHQALTSGFTYSGDQQYTGQYQGGDVQVQGDRAYGNVPGAGQNKDGSIDRRTKAGREAADDDVIGLSDIDWNNLPLNEDKTVDQRTKVGRALKAAGMLDTDGRLLQGANAAMYQRNTNIQTADQFNNPPQGDGGRNRPSGFAPRPSNPSFQQPVMHGRPGQGGQGGYK